MDDFDPRSYLETRKWFSDLYGLEKITLLLSKLGNPERGLKFIHVAGTNGKGSTCAYIASILKRANMRVGLYTSPYIETIEERIQINGENIPPKDLDRLTAEVRDAAFEVESELGEHPSSFEILTAIAFMYFKNEQCDVVVLECGLGGRLDATNVIEPLVSVITRIGLDHTEVLGVTLEEIASEKAGIIKPGVPVVAFPGHPKAADVIREKCEELGCRLITPDFANLQILSVDMNGQLRPFIYKDMDFETKLLANYQPYNAICAIEATKAAFPDLIDYEIMAEGIKDTDWPGRFEVLKWDPFVVVDGAHNEGGALALVESVQELIDAKRLHEGVCAPYPETDITFVFGVLADKDYVSMIKAVIPLSKKFVVYEPSNPRALSAEDLSSAIKSVEPASDVAIEQSAKSAVVYAMQNESPEGIVITFGTLYSISEIKEAVLKG